MNFGLRVRFGSKSIDSGSSADGRRFSLMTTNQSQERIIGSRERRLSNPLSSPLWYRAGGGSIRSSRERGRLVRSSSARSTLTTDSSVAAEEDKRVISQAFQNFSFICENLFICGQFFFWEIPRAPCEIRDFQERVRTSIPFPSPYIFAPSRLRVSPMRSISREAATTRKESLLIHTPEAKWR